MKPMWLGKHPVLSDKHIDGLETDAGIAEFGPNKLPREQAEKQAYDSYVRKQRELAVAFHAVGQKLALAGGDAESAKKHGVMIQTHLEALGHDSVAPLPPEIEGLKGQAKAYRFRAHPGDLWAVNDSKKE